MQCVHYCISHVHLSPHVLESIKPQECFKMPALPGPRSALVPPVSAGAIWGVCWGRPFLCPGGLQQTPPQPQSSLAHHPQRMKPLNYRRQDLIPNTLRRPRRPLMVRNVGNVGSCKFMTLLQEEMRQGEVAAGGTERQHGVLIEPSTTSGSRADPLPSPPSQSSPIPLPSPLLSSTLQSFNPLPYLLPLPLLFPSSLLFPSPPPLSSPLSPLPRSSLLFPLQDRATPISNLLTWSPQSRWQVWGTGISHPLDLALQGHLPLIPFKWNPNTGLPLERAGRGDKDFQRQRANSL